MRKSLIFGLSSLALACAGSPAIARKPRPSAAEMEAVAASQRAMTAKQSMLASIDALKPGDYMWYANRASPGPVEIVISLSQQRIYAFQSGALLGVATVSSGKKGAESPYGRFEILEKKKMHRSIRYDNAPMPNMMRLNWHGVALHGGNVPGYPASHGCIRLPHAFAAKLFETAKVGSFVFVTHDEPMYPEDALELARANYDAPTKPDRLPRGVTEAPVYAEADLGFRAAAYAEQAAEPASEPRPEPVRPRRGIFGRIGGIF